VCAAAPRPGHPSLIHPPTHPGHPQIVYFAVVVITEIIVLYNEDARAKQLAKQAKSRGGKKNAEADADDKARRTEVEIGNVETAANPMFLTQSGAAAQMDASSIIESLVRQSQPPSVEQWRVVQSTFLDTHAQVSALKEQLLEAKREMQQGGGGRAGAAEPVRAVTTKKAFAPTTSAAAGSATNPLLKGKSGMALKQKAAVE
jgi:hypothetical protein